jgi:hypothetical protein
MEATFSGEVLESEFLDRVGFKFPVPGQGNSIMSLCTLNGAFGVQLRLDIQMYTYVVDSDFLNEMNGRYRTVNVDEIYLDDSGSEQEFVAENGDRIILWVSQLGQFGDVQGLWGRWKSASGSEVISLRFENIDFHKSSCWSCYYSDD